MFSDTYRCDMMSKCDQNHFPCVSIFSSFKGIVAADMNALPGSSFLWIYPHQIKNFFHLRLISLGSEKTLHNTVVQAWLHYLKSKKCWIYWFWYLHLGLYFKYIVKEKIKCNYLLKMMLNKCEFCPRLSLNILAKLRRHASRVHFAKIHFR